MTLLDAPAFDEAKARRNRILGWSAVGAVVVLFVASWFVAGQPIDWPWNWPSHFFGRSATNHFLSDVEHNDMAGAYGIWMHDKDWQQHPERHSVYPFSRFEEDWGPTSTENDYGVIQSHRIAAARMYGNSLLMAILINGRKSKALSLEYDPHDGTLSYAPPDVEIDPESYK
jgi:hypothetical protein